jgi:hypothetical protein
MEARVECVLQDLAADGYAKLGSVADAALVDRCRRSAQVLRTHHSANWDGARGWRERGTWMPTLFAGGSQNAVYYDCLGIDAGLDAAAEALLAIPAIETLLDAAVGVDRRLWFAQLRWAEPGGDEYPLHQDVYGELAICLYLDDHPDDAGSIVFWPGSHRWPRFLDRLPNLLPGMVPAGRLGAVSGRPGDLCVFLNKTWHGRTSARAERVVFLISFLPPGPIEWRRRMPEMVRAALGPRLQRVTAPAAAMPFGDRPPAIQPFSSSFEAHPTFADGRAPNASIAALRASASATGPEARAILDRVLADQVAPAPARDSC